MNVSVNASFAGIGLPSVVPVVTLMPVTTAVLPYMCTRRPVIFADWKLRSPDLSRARIAALSRVGSTRHGLACAPSAKSDSSVRHWQACVGGKSRPDDPAPLRQDQKERGARLRATEEPEPEAALAACSTRGASQLRSVRPEADACTNAVSHVSTRSHPRAWPSQSARSVKPSWRIVSRVPPGMASI